MIDKTSAFLSRQTITSLSDIRHEIQVELGKNKEE